MSALPLVVSRQRIRVWIQPEQSLACELLAQGESRRLTVGPTGDGCMPWWVIVRVDIEADLANLEYQNLCKAIDVRARSAFLRQIENLARNELEDSVDRKPTVGRRREGLRLDAVLGARELPASHKETCQRLRSANGCCGRSLRPEPSECQQESTQEVHSRSAPCHVRHCRQTGLHSEACPARRQER